MRHLVLRKFHLSCSRPLAPSSNALSVAIIGSGPAGMYTADELLRCDRPPQRIDIFEQSPLPFGLLRYGVAPDHPEVKLVSHKFQNEVLDDGSVRMYGRVKVGRDITLSQLMEAYDAVFICTGASKPRRISLPVEQEEEKSSSSSSRVIAVADDGSVDGFITADSFVRWYNTSPDATPTPPPLSSFSFSSFSSCVILGAGNVALDVARILLSPMSTLTSTDIARNALQQLQQWSVKNVHIVARRDMTALQFAPRELRELCALPQLNITLPNDVIFPPDSSVHQRPLKRVIQLLKEASSSSSSPSSSSRSLFVSPLRTPEVLIVDSHRRLRGVRMRVDTVTYDGEKGVAIVREGNVREEVSCQMMVTSVGYECVSPDASVAPVDVKKNCLQNEKGRVKPGLYVTGWAKRGPSGIVPSNKWDAAETVQTFLHDALEQQERKPGRILLPKTALSWDQMEKICNAEQARGEGKFLTWDEMQQVLTKK